MKKETTSEEHATVEPTVDSTRKKAYQSPTLRTFGSIHRITQSTSAGSGDGVGTMMMKSDRATKENIVRIGDHPLGIGVYLFEYRSEYRDASGHGIRFGVLADEVETVMPEAVAIHPDGYKVVNYSMLGISQAV